MEVRLCWQRGEHSLLPLGQHDGGECEERRVVFLLAGGRLGGGVGGIGGGGGIHQ